MYLPCASPPSESDDGHGRTCRAFRESNSGLGELGSGTFKNVDVGRGTVDREAGLGGALGSEELE